MAPLTLVFRTVGERTSDLSLELAKKHIQPVETFTLSHIRPFAKTVEAMLTLPVKTDHIVTVDADCLFLRDLAPILEKHLDEPYVEGQPFDRFRGWVSGGVHVFSRRLWETMRGMAPPAPSEIAAILRPEARRRKCGLAQMQQASDAVMPLPVYHDYLQWHHDLWAKMALRELRSRTPVQKAAFAEAQRTWGDHTDFVVARDAVQWVRGNVAENTSAAMLTDIVKLLPTFGLERVDLLKLPKQPRLSRAELDTLGPLSNWEIDARPV